MEKSGTARIRTRPVDEDTAWYAIRVRPRFEKAASQLLRNMGYQEFLPLYPVRARLAGQAGSLPLFPEYVFCNLNASLPRPDLVINGQNAVAGSSGSWTPILECELNEIRAILKAGARCEPWPYLSRRQTVRVTSGILTGIQGVIVEDKGRWRLVVSMTTLQRSVATEIDLQCLGTLAPGWSELHKNPWHGSAA